MEAILGAVFGFGILIFLARVGMKEWGEKQRADELFSELMRTEKKCLIEMGANARRYYSADRLVPIFRRLLDVSRQGKVILPTKEENVVEIDGKRVVVFGERFLS